MCDCVCSIPLSSSCINLQEFGLIQSTRYHSPIIFHCAGASIGRRNILSTRASRKSRVLGPEERDFYGELGFKEKAGEHLELESKIQNDDENYSTGFDILEFEDKKRSGKSERNEIEDSRRGRQLIRRSRMFAKQVISMESALSLGFVSQIWVDTASWRVLIVEVRPKLLSGESERFPLEKVEQVGDVILVEDESVLDNELKMVGLETLVGYQVVTPSWRHIGKVRGYYFDINSGAVKLLELDSFGISIIPSSLVSTYALAVNDVLEVLSDTVIVHEAAGSQIQRLTKGFWDAQNLRTSVEEIEEYSDSEISGRSDNGRVQRNYGRETFGRKTRKFEDDWELPMDYL